MKNPFADYLHLIRTIQRAKREGRTGDLMEAAKESARIHKLMLQPQRHETASGAAELGWGLAILCLALSSYAVVVLPQSPWRGWISQMLMLAACVAMPVCLWAGRRYVTWPRLGYVVFRWEKSQWIGLIVGMVVAAVVSIGLVIWMQPEIARAAKSALQPAAAPPPAALGLAGKMMLIALGPMNALLYLMMAATSLKDHRWKWLLALLVAVGPLGICLLVPGGFIEVSRPVMLFLGLAGILSGMVTLLCFLRRHQPTAGEIA